MALVSSFNVLCTIGPFRDGLLLIGAFNIKILNLLSFHRVLHERDSMTGNKGVTLMNLL